ncbi:MAG: inositol 2-dehydrogenase [Anaerolineae bacterium]|nr:inositol 2-dehydrogenase [Thermoflexales bacterium]MDW8396872.1 inositol 2-dehydrogenase [Anaerolineae bacterium]
MPPLRIGLIGAGRIGQVHAATIAQRVRSARILAVADANEGAACACAEQHNIPIVSTEPERLIADPNLDAVLICSPTDTHAAYIELAAQAGKHIFCEKPIALTLEATDRALAAVSRAGVKLQVGFNRRFDPSFERLRRAIAAGEIGELHLLRITSRDPAPPPPDYVKASGGLFLDMAIHDFDMARYLSGSEIEEVYALGAARIDPTISDAGDIDTALITLRFANGAFGAIDNSRKSIYGYDQRAEAFGSLGAAEVLNHYPNQVILSNAAGIHRDQPLHFFMQRYLESYQREIEAFIRAVLSNELPPVTGADGRAALAVALAAQRSLAERRPVRVAEVSQ